MTDVAAPAASTTTTTSAPDEGNVQSNIMAQVAKARAASESASESADGAPELEEGAAAADGEDKPKADDKAPKVKDDPKMAAKFAAIARHSAKVRTREDAVNAKERTFVDREQRIAQHEQALSQQAVAYRELAEAERDPATLLRYLVKRGVPLESVVSHSMAEADPAMRAEKLTQKTVSEVEALKKQIADRDVRDQHAASQQHVQQSEEQFLTLIADETKFEAANVAYSKSETLRVGYHLDKIAKSRGLNWDLASLAQAVNEFAESGYELDVRGNVVQSERYKKVKARFGATAATAAPTKVTPGTGPRATPAKTLTNSDAGERDQGLGFEDLTPEERIRRIAARARQGSRSTMA